MDADIGDDSTKLSLFSVLDLSLVWMSRDEKRLFLSLVVLARGVLATLATLASLWRKVGRWSSQCPEFFPAPMKTERSKNTF